MLKSGTQIGREGGGGNRQIGKTYIWYKMRLQWKPEATLQQANEHATKLSACRHCFQNIFPN